MSVALGNGKVIISEKAITIKRTFGSDVVQKKSIENIEAMGNIALAIWFTISIIGLYKAIQMYQGKKLVTIKAIYDKEYTFWLRTNDYRKLQENL